MATLALIGSGTSSSNGFSTGTLTWGTDTFACIAIATAQTSAPTSHTATGTETWVEMGSGVEIYAGRRAVSVMTVSGGGTPTDEAITLTAVGGSGYQENFWIAFEIAEYSSGNVPKADFISSHVDTGTSMNAGAIGTIAGDDISIIIGTLESGADNFAASAGTTELQKLSGGANVRSLLVGSSTTDSTPGIVWDTSGNGAGMMAFMAQDGATGSHGGGGGGLSIPVAMHHYINNTGSGL